MSDPNQASHHPILQPIHPDILPRLLPECADFHNQTYAYVPMLHSLTWDPAFRDASSVPGASMPLQVGSVKDYDLSAFQVRVFTPEGDAPPEGWPVFLFFHGGGWMFGNIDTENAYATNMCKRASCVVVCADYRLAPEHPYPAAVEDAVEALHWVVSNAKTLNVNVAKYAVGGTSSGGNLAAIVAHKAALASPPIPLTLQLLVVPVLDSTASASDNRYPSWKECENTLGLVPETMLWFKQHYCPNPENWKNWDISPMFAPEETFRKAPPAWIALSELDILRDEGLAYAEKLKGAGVRAETKVYMGAHHLVVAMDGDVLDVGKQLVTDAVEALKKAFKS